MTRSGQDYLDSLRDGRSVWLDGELVKDITEHPAFRNTARSIAHLYDLARDEKLRDILTATPEGTGPGDPVLRAYQVPRSHADLVRRRAAFKTWSEASYGFLGRSPDYMAAGIAGFVSAPEIFAGTDGGFDGRDNLAAYYRRMSSGSLYQSFTITNPQIDRTKSASEQEENDLYVRVVKERDDGIVVRGAKMIGTAAVFGDEIIVGTIEPLAPQDIEHALTFSTPIDTPGLKFISRASYEASARSVFDNPLSSRFDENDALLVCDDVFVPWERVLTYRDVQASFLMWWGTPAYHHFVHQASVRFWTKLEFLTGLAILIAKSNNTYQLPPVQMQIGRLIGWLNIARSMVIAAESEFERVGTDPDGPVHINREIASAHRAMAGDLYPKFLAEIKMLAGGGLIQLPASGYDLTHPELGPLVAKYVRSPGTPSEQRIKLLKLAWDALGSEFASRHEQYERFYHGAPHVYLPGIVRDGDPDRLAAFTQSCMDGYDLGTGPAGAAEPGAGHAR
ncbi:4-hydroxyphenylacetate 3-hydroxylase family protein [Streptomyces xiamenensis]|uniref:4-hydroxyphenylacetate 3-hydroxylase family protein n=1 Tax=Streptomyces xiamenensis TaxID=408015 RepID=UPI0035D9204B